MITNPFDAISELLVSILTKLDRIDQKTRDEPEKQYTVKEVAEILRHTPQTVRKKIEEGIIAAETNTKPYLIPHSAIYKEDNSLRELRYKRKKA